MKRALVLVSAVVALAFVAVGCGGGDDEADPTAAWATDFCSTVSSWTTELESIGSSFTDVSSFNEESIEAAATDAREATNTLVDDLRALGAPPTDSGDEIEASIDELSTELESQSGSIETAVDGLTSLADLPEAVTAITTSLTAMATAFQSTVTTIQDADVGGELESALEDSPECDEITD